MSPAAPGGRYQQEGGTGRGKVHATGPRETSGRCSQSWAPLLPPVRGRWAHFAVGTGSQMRVTVCLLHDSEGVS